MEYFNNPINGQAYPIITKDTPNGLDITPFRNAYALGTRHGGNYMQDDPCYYTELVDVEDDNHVCKKSIYVTRNVLELQTTKKLTYDSNLQMDIVYKDKEGLSREDREFYVAYPHIRTTCVGLVNKAETMLCVIPNKEKDSEAILNSFKPTKEHIIPIDYKSIDIKALLGTFHTLHPDPILGIYLRNKIFDDFEVHSSVNIPYTEHVKYVKKYVLPHIPYNKVIILT